MGLSSLSMGELISESLPMVCLNSTLSPLISLNPWQYNQEGNTGYNIYHKNIDLNAQDQQWS